MMTTFLLLAEMKNFTQEIRDGLGLDKAMDPNNTEFASVFDLDGTFNRYQKLAVSLGRGDNPRYGNIDDLPSKSMTGAVMFVASIGRGNDVRFANVDDLIYLQKYKKTGTKILQVSKERAKNNA